MDNEFVLLNSERKYEIKINKTFKTCICFSRVSNN